MRRLSEQSQMSGLYLVLQQPYWANQAILCKSVKEGSVKIDVDINPYIKVSLTFCADGRPLLLS